MSVEEDIESMQESREIDVGDRKEQIFLCITRMSTYHKSKGTVLMLEVHEGNPSCILYKST